MKRVLVVGGTGFLGSSFINSAVKKKFKVYSLSTKKPVKSDKIKNVKYLICDISSYSSLVKVIKFNVDYVINFGGYVDHANKRKTFKSHFIGCKNLVRFFKNKPIKKFIQIGSSLEYGDTKSPHIEKNSKFSSQALKSIYAKSKLLSTKHCLDANKRYLFPVTILRPYLIYGPGQKTNRLIPFIVTQCLNGKVFSCSTGMQVRNFLFINDFTKAMFMIFKSKDTTGQIINIGSNKSLKVKSVIKKIQKLINNGKPQFGKIRLRKDETLDSYPSIKKIQKLTFWYPKTNFDDGLISTINYLRKQNEKFQNNR